MKKTLGGDRLGSGNRMQIELHNYERSTHDLGYLWRSTMSAGTLVPFMSELALPGDTFDIDLNCDIKTHPTIGPLFGSYKVQLDVFLAPIRLYQAMLHNNALGIGLNMAQVKLPIITMTATDITDAEDKDNAQVNPSSLLAYLGIRGVGQTTDADITRDFQCIPILAYWEIYKNYYANKQEEIGAVIHTPAEAIITTVEDIKKNNVDAIDQAPLVNLVTFDQASDELFIHYTFPGTPTIWNQIFLDTVEHGTITADDLVSGGWSDNGTGEQEGVYDIGRWGTTTVKNWRYKDSTDINTGKPGIATFPLDNIDDMRNAILASSAPNTTFSITLANITPYKWLSEQIGGINNVLSSQEGLALKTYQSDLFNNWLQTEWIDGTNGINAITAIDTSGGSFTIDTLNLSKKVYDMLNRIAVSGGSYDDWLDAQYMHDRYTRCESPMYMGGLIKELVFQEVVSNTESADQPLGTLAGKGVMSGKHKGGKVVVKVDEPSYIIGIVSLTPRIDYSQGNKWDVHLKTMNDLHVPALDEIGFQELITEQMAWWDTTWDSVGNKWLLKSAGKQPAWINYMTNVNRVFGNFAISTNEMFMTLNRRYQRNDISLTIEDLTTYIDPSKFNFIFAETALDAQNFWTQIAVDITARRKMSAKLMPNL